MERCILAVSSVTYAIKGVEVLSRAGIAAEAVKLGASRTRRGCTSGIAVPAPAQHTATHLLSRAGIPFSEVLPEQEGEKKRGRGRGRHDLS